MPVSSDLPDWNDLRDLLLVHEAGSLSAAARFAGVSQSTMSRRLAAVEAGGARAFARDALGALALTERGEAMVLAARVMRAAYDDLLANLDAVPRPIRIAACEVTAQLFVADALPEWARQGRDPADLAIYDDLFSLPAAQYDILVTPGESLPEGAQGLEIGRIDWGLYAAPGYLAVHPVRPGANALDGHKVIRASGSLGEIGAYAKLKALGGQPAMTSSSPVAQLEACARGLGLALLPKALARDDGRIRELGMPVADASPVWLIADAKEASHPRIATFLRWARGHFRSR
ncbi:LysR family transcriptional regulator [Defluviimonas sp. WL0002]|uniref:LysR family transcriptional regulator n=1 Tax=Albidovulum marisflavi TaxID=2984159 RepID=A0ABT2ZG13_9RHOB|nr:LysR family transcriptional regulator [Defluviimonas sp. WL0002]MCV2870057.1 LysR family transcriptional regulator [Defluviimonas sp. WL0002]